MFEIAENLIQSKESHNIRFRVFCPTIYEDEYMYFYRGFLSLKSERLTES